METKHASKTCIIFIALLFFTISSIAQTWDGGAGTQNWGDAANCYYSGINKNQTIFKITKNIVFFEFLHRIKIGNNK